MSGKSFLPRLFRTPPSARMYLFFAAFFLALPAIADWMVTSHAGKFLIAETPPRSSPFYKTVIYLAEHNAGAAMGFIINKPLEKWALERAKERFPHIQNFRYGGPVMEPYAEFLTLPNRENPRAFRIASIDDLRDQEPELYARIVQDQEFAQGVWYIRGYAGWSMMQLNRELFRGGWTLMEYDDDFMFALDPEEQWPKAVLETFEPSRLPAGAI